jgi:hypothetical protein
MSAVALSVSAGDSAQSEQSPQHPLQSQEQQQPPQDPPAPHQLQQQQPPAPQQQLLPPQEPPQANQQQPPPVVAPPAPQQPPEQLSPPQHSAVEQQPAPEAIALQLPHADNAVLLTSPPPSEYDECADQLLKQKFVVASKPPTGMPKYWRWWCDPSLVLSPRCPYTAVYPAVLSISTPDHESVYDDWLVQGTLVRDVSASNDEPVVFLAVVYGPRRSSSVYQAVVCDLGAEQAWLLNRSPFAHRSPNYQPSARLQRVTGETQLDGELLRTLLRSWLSEATGSDDEKQPQDLSPMPATPTSTETTSSSADGLRRSTRTRRRPLADGGAAAHPDAAPAASDIASASQRKKRHSAAATSRSSHNLKREFAEHNDSLYDGDGITGDNGYDSDNGGALACVAFKQTQRQPLRARSPPPTLLRAGVRVPVSAAQQQQLPPAPVQQQLAFPVVPQHQILPSSLPQATFASVPLPQQQHYAPPPPPPPPMLQQHAHHALLPQHQYQPPLPVPQHYFYPPPPPLQHHLPPPHQQQQQQPDHHHQYIYSAPPPLTYYGAPAPQPPNALAISSLLHNAHQRAAEERERAMLFTLLPPR